MELVNKAIQNQEVLARLGKGLIRLQSSAAKRWVHWSPGHDKSVVRDFDLIEETRYNTRSDSEVYGELLNGGTHFSIPELTAITKTAISMKANEAIKSEDEGAIRKVRDVIDRVDDWVYRKICSTPAPGQEPPDDPA